MVEDIRDMWRRTANLESSRAGVRSDIALLHAIAAQDGARTDAVLDRLERMERRLGLLTAERESADYDELTAIPFSASSFIALSFLVKCVNPMPRSTLGALVNWILS
jgi:hypothetical protein